jgi:hypothetical protein
MQPIELIHNIVIQTFLNLNFTIILNVFLYTAAGTLGILLVKEVIIEFFIFLRCKLLSRYERRAEEIKELNNKMHDRLVELVEIMRSDGKNLEKYAKIKHRLLYNSSRLKKYNKTIPIDIDELFELFLLQDTKMVCAEENKEKAFKLVDLIKEKVDLLWVKKS